MGASPVETRGSTPLVSALFVGINGQAAAPTASPVCLMPNKVTRELAFWIPNAFRVRAAVSDHAPHRCFFHDKIHAFNEIKQ